MLSLFTLCLLVAVAYGHEVSTGQCPTFPDMKGFDWDRFSEGRWYALEKFGTKEQKCLTYDFGVNGYGFKEIKQRSVLRTLSKLSLDNYHTSRGNLEQPYSASPAKMTVRFATNLYGPSSWVIMDTDYSDYALLCTCQSAGLIVTTLHRRSCTILGREPIRKAETMKQVKDFLDSKVKHGSGDFSHDFDIIDHRNCEYDSTKGLDIDVDKIIGSSVGTQIRDVFEEALDTVGDVFEGSDIEEAINNNLPLKDDNPKV